MSTVLRLGPYRFYFFEGEADEPAHIHVQRDRDRAKLWLSPVAVAWNRRFSDAEIRTITRLVTEHHETLLHAWNTRPGPGPV